MSCSRPLASALALTLLFSSALAAQDSLTLDRIFNSEEFAPEQLGRVRWLEKEPAYVKLEADSATPGGRSLVRYDAATGKREVWIPARRLVPPGDSMPLAVEDYSVSPEFAKLIGSFGFAPAFNKISSTAGLPSSAARASGVTPYLFLALTSAPARMRAAADSASLR